MEKLKEEDFRKLCFEIIERYKNQPKFAAYYDDKIGYLVHLQLCEFDTKTVLPKSQTKISIGHFDPPVRYYDPVSGKFLYNTISELIEEIKKRDFSVNICVEIKGKVTKFFKKDKQAYIGRLLDTYFMITLPKYAYFRNRYAYFWVVNMEGKYPYPEIEFYLIDKATATLYLL